MRWCGVCYANEHEEKITNKKYKQVSSSASEYACAAREATTTTHKLRGRRGRMRGAGRGPGERCTCGVRTPALRSTLQLDFRTSNGRACIGWIAKDISSFFFSFHLLTVFVYNLLAHFRRSFSIVVLN